MSTQDPFQPAQTLIAEAISAAGGGIATARACGVTHQAVYAWVSRGRVPLHHVETLCAAGAHRVSAIELLDAMARYQRERRARPAQQVAA